MTTIQNINTPQQVLENETTQQSGDGTPSFVETMGKRLKATLIIIAKASHHKAFMETCLLRNTPP